MPHGGEDATVMPPVRRRPPWTTRLTLTTNHLLGRLLHYLVVVITLPYSRFFQFNTLGVIRRIAKHASRPDDFPLLLRVLARWRHRKLAELQYISIACAVLLAAVIGTFSWNNIDESYWLARAFWYISLVLSILGILLSAQQVAVLNFLGDIPSEPENTAAHDAVKRYLPLLVISERRLPVHEETQKTCSAEGSYRPRFRMVFVWQSAVMFMSYSVCSFLAGLTLWVMTPLIRLGEIGWTPNANVAVIYLATSAVSITIFVFNAFWVYQYLDLDTDALLDAEPLIPPMRSDSFR